MIGRADNSICDISGKEDTGIAGLLRFDRRDADFSKRRRRTVVFIVPSERGIAGLVARLAHDRHEIEHDRTLTQAFLELLGVKIRSLCLCSVWREPELAGLWDQL